MNIDPLLVAVRNKEKELGAWSNVYIEHRDAMFGAAYKVVHNREDAEDAMQQALHGMMSKGLPDTVDNLRAYLAQAARNSAIDIVRKNKHIDNSPLAESVSTTYVDPETEVVRRIALETSIVVLGQLPMNHQHAIRERWLAGRPAKDVAAELGVTPQRISQLVCEGLEMIEERSPFISHDQNDPSTSAPTTKPKKDFA